MRGRFEIYEDFAGKYRWRLWGAGSQIEADSAESYDTPGQAAEAARRAQAEADGADVHGSSEAEVLW